MLSEPKTVVILGASDREERYSNKAQRLLMKQGYRVVPVHPSISSIETIPVMHEIGDVPRRPDVMSVYVNPSVSTDLADDIIALSPRVAIFNPKTENPALEDRLASSGTVVVRACTIVLLTTGRFASAITV